MIPGITSSGGKKPGSATSVSASAGNGQATVSFTVPVYDGKGVATYQVYSTPQALYANGASSPITVTGLSNGTSYTFNVQTISGYGPSANSVASNAVTPAAPAPPSFGPSFPVCQGCAPGLYGYYGGYSVLCFGGNVYYYYQSECCPDYSVGSGASC